MKILAKILGILFALLLAVAVGAFFWVQDANRLKPELAALITENSDYAVAFNGDLAWRLFPPLSLSIEGMRAEREAPGHRDYQLIEANTVQLDVDLSAIWQDVNEWQVTDLRITDATITSKNSVSQVNNFALNNFRPGESTAFELDAASITDPDAPVHATAEGAFTYWPAEQDTPQRITFAKTKIAADLVTGVCDGEATENPLAPAALPDVTKDDLLPLDTLLEYDFAVRCQLDSLILGTETFNNSDVDLNNTNGALQATLNVRDFLNGTLTNDLTVDTKQQPLTWAVTPKVEQVDSQRLIDWTEQNLQWIAAIGLNSTLTMTGNTKEALATSVKALTDFDGGQGQLNIAKIKAQLLKLAALTNKTEDVERWPDMWDYQSFVGNWQINGKQHALAFSLDNMDVTADGTYDYLSDQLDLSGHVTINEALESTPFEINPLLQGTPIPIRCRGSMDDPTCRVDEKAGQKMIARALQRDDDSGLRRKLEDKIEEKVPEEYRETARDLLDLLGRALEGGDDEKE